MEPYVIIEIIIGLLAIIESVFVIFMILWYEKLKTRISHFIIWVSIADLLTGLIAIPSELIVNEGVIINHFPCLLALACLISIISLSKLLVLAIAVDRYMAVLHPFDYFKNYQKSTPRVSIILCWLSATIFGFLIFFWNEGDDVECSIIRKIPKVYFYLRHTLFAVIPLCALVVLSILIVKRIREINRNGGTLSRQGSTNNHESLRRSQVNSNLINIQGPSRASVTRSEVNVTLNLFIVIITFTLCWMPRTIFHIYDSICNSCIQDITYFRLVMTVSHLPAIINPFVYAFHTKNFRDNLKNLFKRGEI